MECLHKETQANGLCTACGYNTLGLTNKELKALENNPLLRKKLTVARIPSYLSRDGQEHNFYKV